MRRWIKKRLTKISYDYLRSQPSWSRPSAPEIAHARVLPYCSHAPWINDTEFQAAYEEVKEHTLLDVYRLYELWSLARQLDGLEGDFLEVGVWRGGSGCLLALASQREDRQLFLADTFTGVVKVGEHDTGYSGGEHADTTLEQVHELLRRCMQEKRVHVLEGIFPEKNAECVGQKLALIHIDVDVFESARDVLLWTLPRLVVGGTVIFDDYGFYGCEGVTRMVNEFVPSNHDFRFLHNLNGHAILVRVANNAQ